MVWEMGNDRRSNMMMTKERNKSDRKVLTEGSSAGFALHGRASVKQKNRAAENRGFAETPLVEVVW